MYEQAYHGSCPEDDLDGFGLGVKLSSPLGLDLLGAVIEDRARRSA